MKVWQNSQRLAKKGDYFDIQEIRLQAMYEIPNALKGNAEK